MEPTVPTYDANDVLTRDAIISLDDRVIEPVKVAAWGNKVVFISSLTGTERDAYEIEAIENKRDKKGKIISSEINLKNLRARLVVRTAVTSLNPAEAKPLFRPSDAEWLGTKNAAALQELFAAAQRLSGLSDADVEELADELGKDPSGDSGTDLPSPSESPASEPSSGGSAQPNSLNGGLTILSSPSESGASTSSSPT